MNRGVPVCPYELTDLRNVEELQELDIRQEFNRQWWQREAVGAAEPQANLHELEIG